MDDLDNKGYNSENGTPYEPPLGEQGTNTRYVPEFDQQNGQAQYQNTASSVQQEISQQQPYGSTAQQNSYNNNYQTTPSQNAGSNPYGDIRQYDDYYKSVNNNYQNGYQYNNNGYNNSYQYNGYQNNNGYNGYNGGYQNGYPQNFQPAYNNGYPGQWAQRQNTPKTYGLAVASMVIALVNLLMFRTILSVIAVPLSLIFSIVSLAKKRDGKGFAITGIVVSVISAVLFVSGIFLFAKLYPDLKYFFENSQQIIADYKEDGSIPEEFEKYNDPRFDKYWKAMGCDDFNEFFGMFIETFESNYGDNNYKYDDDFDYYYDNKKNDGITDLVFAV